MRHLTTIALGLSLAACSNQPTATDEELEDFDPPTVTLRGDVAPQVERRFERLDRNKDGFASADEFKRDGAARIAPRDVNKDGKLSRGEMVETALQRFDRRDADKDGQVTPQERTAAGNAF